MEAKEKAIREAYGTLGIEWDSIKDHLTENYWIRNPYEPVDLLWLIRDEKGIEVVIKGDNLGRLCFVPKSLAGIENNNGWIRIESEADLPIETDSYFVVYKDGCIICHHFSVSSDFDRVLFIQEFTHYQPIVKPNLPIY